MRGTGGESRGLRYHRFVSKRMLGKALSRIGKSVPRGIRLFDAAFSLFFLTLLCPLLPFAALGIVLSSRGPIFYRAQRVGLNGRVFTMFKLRTMHVRQPKNAGVITAREDARIFPLGRRLRRLKIDELPQLYNVLKGDMAIVGPRPRDPRIVNESYTPLHKETLQVLPGLTSPGSIFYLTHCEALLPPDDPNKMYVQDVLPIKLSLDIAYIRESPSLRYNLRIIARTVGAILGQKRLPPEMRKSREHVQPTETTSLQPETAPAKTAHHGPR